MSLQHLYKAYSDGELSIVERNLVQKELESDEAARKEVEDLRRLSKSIREYVTQPEPAGLEATLAALERVKPKVQQRRAVVHSMWWLGSAAAGLFLFAFVAGKINSGGSADASATVATPSESNVKLKAEFSPADSRAQMGGATGGGLHDSISPGGGSSGAAAKASGGFGGGGRALGGNSGSFGKSLDQSAAPSDSTRRPQSVVGLATPASPAPHRQPQLIEKTAGLTVKVKNVAEAQQAVETVAKGSGGWVQESNRSEAEGQTGTAAITVRVPVSQFENTLKAIRALGDVVADSSSGNDVTGDVVDMDARLKVLRAEESDYMILLGRARRTGEIMEIRDKLTEIRTEIESILGQRNATKDQAAFSTINVTLTQRPTVGDHSSKSGDGADSWVGDTWASAVNGLSSVGRLLGQLLIFMLVWSPIWVPTALLGSWIYRKLKW